MKPGSSASGCIAQPAPGRSAAMPSSSARATECPWWPENAPSCSCQIPAFLTTFTASAGSWWDGIRSRTGVRPPPSHVFRNPDAQDAGGAFQLAAEEVGHPQQEDLLLAILLGQNRVLLV